MSLTSRLTVMKRSPSAAIAYIVAIGSAMRYRVENLLSRKNGPCNSLENGEMRMGMRIDEGLMRTESRSRFNGHAVQMKLLRKRRSSLLSLSFLRFSTSQGSTFLMALVIVLVPLLIHALHLESLTSSHRGHISCSQGHRARDWFRECPRRSWKQEVMARPFLQSGRARRKEPVRPPRQQNSQPSKHSHKSAEAKHIFRRLLTLWFLS